MQYGLVVFLAVVASFASAQQEVTIVRSENENKGDGTFSWLSELSDGTKVEQSGYIKDGPDPDAPIQVIQGSYSYISPEGENIQVQYVADENGFVPQGDHLPTSPPIPEEIQKSLDIILRAGASPVGAASFQRPQYKRPASIAKPSRSFSSPPRRY